MIRNLFLVCVFATLLYVAVACGSTKPETQEIEVRIQLSSVGVIVMDPDLIEAKQDDTLVLSIVSEKEGMMHIHGYDLGIMVSPENAAVFEFDAATTGRFEVMFHAVGSNDSSHSHDAHGHASHKGSSDEADNHTSHETSSSGEGQSIDQFLGYLQVMPR
ncbi:MAG: hypothetical protein CL793_03395 [Chloroflexi bacterium]|nr:hypothetical protein [Chloroflexota bacterium]|tara:strand:+ start:467 stop:946 length:480 start_codon:yes stop_codon:yes gene_type:complete